MGGQVKRAQAEFKKAANELLGMLSTGILAS
jgi:hypothetical protein